MSDTRTDIVYLGIKGAALALSRSTGEILWQTDLTGGDFVNLLKDGDAVFAATKGEIFCLEAETGEIRWRNKLPGMGFGMITIATDGGSTGIAVSAHKKRQDDSAAAVVAT
jgi:outer membrane protein assembly factor BamB